MSSLSLSLNPNSYTSHLKNVSNVYQLSQTVKEPTRVTTNSSSLIDIVLTNTPERVVRAGVTELSISDHKLIYAIRIISVSQNIKQKVSIFRNFSHFNLVEFHSDLSKIDWDSIDDFFDPNDMWEHWKSLFVDIDKHAPPKDNKQILSLAQLQSSRSHHSKKKA